jgi:ankyrin repeat protein
MKQMNHFFFKPGGPAIIKRAALSLFLVGMIAFMVPIIALTAAIASVAALLLLAYELKGRNHLLNKKLYHVLYHSRGDNSLAREYLNLNDKKISHRNLELALSVLSKHEEDFPVLETLLTIEHLGLNSYLFKRALDHAVQKNNPRMLTSLFNLGGNIQTLRPYFQYEDESTLRRAISLDHLAVVAALCDASVIDPQRACSQQDFQAGFKHAVSQRKNAVVAFLLSKADLRIDVDQYYSREYYLQSNITPLIDAIDWGNIDIVRVLLDNGADIEKKGAFTSWGEMTPLGFAASKSDNVQIVQLLLDRGANLIVDQSGMSGMSALIHAADHGFVDIVNSLVNSLLARGIDVNHHGQGDAALIKAADGGHTEIVRILLDQESINVNFARGLDQTNVQLGPAALIKAVERGHLDTVQYLLVRPDINVDHVRMVGKTALFIAVSEGVNKYHWPNNLRHNLRIVQALLAHPNTDANYANDKGQTALIEAAKRGQIEIMQALLDWSGINVNHVNKYGDTALIEAAKRGQIEIVQALLAWSGIKVNHVNRNGDTALIAAQRRGHAQMEKALLDFPDIDSTPPLRHAIRQSNHDLVKALLAQDPRRTEEEKDICYAAGEGDVDIVRLLLEHDANVNLTDGNDNTALINAAEHGHEHIVRILLDRAGIEVNYRGQSDGTALIKAAYCGHTEIVRILLDRAGIEVNLRDGNYNTALINAAEHGDEHIVRILLDQAEIEVNYPGQSDETALIKAAYCGHTEIVRILLAREEIDVNYRSSPYDGSALMQVLRRDRIEIVKMLLERETMDVDHIISFFDALEAATGEADVQALRDAQPNVDARIKNLSDALDEVMDGGSIEVAEVLLAQPEMRVMFRFHFAAPENRRGLSQEAVEAYLDPRSTYVDLDIVAAIMDASQADNMGLQAVGSRSGVVRLLCDEDQILPIEGTKAFKQLSACERDPFESTISLQVIKQPCQTSDGHTDELSLMKRWLGQSNQSPRTNAVLPDKTLVPNHALRHVMQALIRLIQEKPIDTSSGTTQEYEDISRALLTAPTAIPAEGLRCPLSGLLTVDPVTTIRGDTYEKTRTIRGDTYEKTRFVQKIGGSMDAMRALRLRGNWAIQTLARHAATFLLKHHTPERKCLRPLQGIPQPFLLAHHTPERMSQAIEKKAATQHSGINSRV